MRIRILVAAAAVITLAACSDTSTAPKQLSPTGRSADLIECRSGYHIATRADGSQYCEEDTGSMMATPADTL